MLRHQFEDPFSRVGRIVGFTDVWRASDVCPQSAFGTDPGQGQCILAPCIGPRRVGAGGDQPIDFGGVCGDGG